MKLPLASAYFPEQHHQHFKLPTNSRFAKWHPPGPPKKGDYSYFISGSATFVKRICGTIPDKNKGVACFEQNFEEMGRAGRLQWTQSVKMRRTLGLSPVAMADMQFGGGTDRRFPL